MKSKVLKKLQINKITISSIKGGITDPDIDNGDSSNCVSVPCTKEPIKCTYGRTMTSAGGSLGCAVGN